MPAATPTPNVNDRPTKNDQHITVAKSKSNLIEINGPTLRP